MKSLKSYINNTVQENVNTNKANELQSKWDKILDKKSPKQVLQDLYSFLVQYKTNVIEQFIDEATNTYRIK